MFVLELQTSIYLEMGSGVNDLLVDLRTIEMYKRRYVH